MNKRVKKLLVSLLILTMLVGTFLPVVEATPLKQLDTLNSNDINEETEIIAKEQEMTISERYVNILPESAINRLEMAERVLQENESRIKEITKSREDAEKTRQEVLKQDRKKADKYLEETYALLDKMELLNESRKTRHKRQLESFMTMGENLFIASFSGTGTAEDPYLITTPEEFNAIRGGIEGYPDWDLTKHYKLMNDIDLSAYSSGEGWIPVGNFTDPITGDFDGYDSFTGSLDGNGFTITNLKINRPENGVFIGLFGSIGPEATIKNVHLDDVQIEGDTFSGSIAGWNEGSVVNCSASGLIKGKVFVAGLVGVNINGEIIDSSVSAVLLGDYAVGGLIGESINGIIRNSHAISVKIEGLDRAPSHVGGLVGVNNNGEIIDSSVSAVLLGDYAVGGLIGESSDGIIRNSHAISVNIDGLDRAPSHVGGLVGRNIRGVINESTASGLIKGYYLVGGLVGENNYGTISNSHALSVEVVGIDVDKNVFDNSFNVGGLIGGNDFGTINESTASGTVKGNYLVGGLVGRSYNGTITNSHAYMMLVEGIDESSYLIGGLVGANVGEINDCTVEADIIKGNYLIGGLVGSQGNKEINNSHAKVLQIEGIGESSYLIGGLVGANDGEINDCTVESEIIKGNYLIGGLTGYNMGTIGNSFANATKIEGVDEESFAISGLVGYNFGAISLSYAFTEQIIINDGSFETIGRIAGINYGILTTNYANSQMSLSTQDGDYVPGPDLYGKDGADIDIEEYNKMFLSFSFNEQLVPAWLDFIDKTIYVPVEAGTDITNLIANFTLSDNAIATVAGVIQESGITPNDYTQPLVYTITAEDDTSSIWTVRVETETEYVHKFLSTLGQAIQCTFFGDPVNISTGNFIDNVSDIVIPTRGIPLEFKRSYNSRDDYTGFIGKGWQHNYEADLTINQDNSVSLRYPDGRIALYEYANGSYIRPTGVFETLQRNPDNTFTLTFKDQSKYRFDATGRLSQIADKNNNVNALSYNGSLLANYPTLPGDR
ncbi:hypothetical protein BHU72_13545 [Desulfuribacillus stibiiarsenatis]|uniref:GLUG domain-containing protein n=1 Tax=Desulfuribacillus stibiiarsenatis TaxID=1390249 RepID=A0A1E5L8F1_9FIRM|nr:GLUG motif-containing protein [Desulfuribacillus stibiiarsenatis]OEH86437.1 hypothetical protein BHU72_13545 [Desulfuribacillus stibiiarsenatis]